MKKTYISPNSETILLAARHQMLAGSPNGDSQIDPYADPIDAGGVAGRGYFFDDDYDDEEEY